MKRCPTPLIACQPGGRCGAAFTLIEIILVLSLVAIMAAAAVPAINGLREDEAARKPLTELAKLAKETRLRAMHDKRPYQIAFTHNSFTATRYLSPYLELAELEKFLQAPAADPQQEQQLRDEIDDGLASIQPYVNWTKSYSLPDNLSYNIQFWHEPAPTEIGGSLVKLWVFQPSGVVAPISINIIHGGNVHSATFTALTADIARTSSQKL